MTDSNDTSNLATLEDHDALADSELDAVTGGAGVHIERLETTITTATSDGLFGPGAINALIKSILGSL